MPVADQLPPAVAEALADFRIVTELPVQWGDMDAFGHVNNVVYFRWFESARIDLLHSYRSEVTMASGGVAPILASIKCDYKKQLHYPDTVFIGSRTGTMGRSSVEIQHTVFSSQLEQVAAVATSVMVVFDYQANRPVRIPDALKQQLTNP